MGWYTQRSNELLVAHSCKALKEELKVIVSAVDGCHGCSKAGKVSLAKHILIIRWQCASELLAYHTKYRSDFPFQ